MGGESAASTMTDLRALDDALASACLERRNYDRRGLGSAPTPTRR